MTRRPESPLEEALHLLDFARSDLAFARLGRERPEVRQGMVAFHLQQAAEKAVKAVMLSRRIDYPFIHNLAQLLVAADSGGVSIPDEVRAIRILTPYAVGARYGDDDEPVSQAEIAEAFHLVEVTLSWAESLIGPLDPAP